MRKFQREVTNFEEIIKIIEQCDVVRLGLYADDYPYVVPLSFGYEAADGSICIYFHCAAEGKKIDLLRADDRACAEFDIFHRYVDTGHSLTADYESVMGFGHVQPCAGVEKVKGIRLLLEHTGYADRSAEQCAALPQVSVYKMVFTSFTAKKRFPN